MALWTMFSFRSEPSGRHSGCTLTLGGLFLVFVVTTPVCGHAQKRSADTLDLIQRYRTARQQILVRQARRNDWTARVLPVTPLSVPEDSLLGTEASSQSPRVEKETALSFPVETVRPVHRLERGWFRDTYPETGWSFLGTTSRLTVFDTTYTRELRARLQAQFGDPTQTLADLPDSTRENAPQFEYWFVVNDSIPVRVTDVNGPRGRGLIVATERHLRDQLVAVRDSVLHPLRQPKRAPYVDYFYQRPADGNATVGRWYRSGFDGQAFFLERISQTEIVPGRRPQVNVADSATVDSTRSGTP